MCSSVSSHYKDICFVILNNYNIIILITNKVVNTVLNVGFVFFKVVILDNGCRQAILAKVVIKYLWRSV